MRVLVVEDETRLARSLQAGLEGEGFAVDVASDGGEALWFARENDYDVMLLDVMLPVVNGYDVCRQLRENEDWTPVLMLTARDDDASQVQGLDTGADDYVTKPFSFDVVLARIRSLVRRGAGERPVALTVGDLVHDPARKTVTRDGEEIDLTTRELALMAFLMRHAGDPVTKAQILGNVWDFAFEGDSNIVEVYIGRLRRKVDRPSDESRIETLRGRGYRLRLPGQGDA